MGYFLQKGFNSSIFKKILYYFLGLILPTFVHAYYNSFLYGGKYSDYFNINFILIIVITIILFMIMEFRRRKQ